MQRTVQMVPNARWCVARTQPRGIDVLPFLLDDDVLWKTEWDERGTDEQLWQWRADIQNGKHGTPDRFNHEPDSIHITPELERWVKEKGAGGRTQIALDLYVKLVEQEHGTIQFVGLPQLKDNPNAPIQRLFVEPAVAPRWVSPDMDPTDWPETKPMLNVVASPSTQALRRALASRWCFYSDNNRARRFAHTVNK